MNSSEFQWYPNVLSAVCWIYIMGVVRCELDVTSIPGHLQPIGSAGVHHAVDVFPQFPDVRTFFSNYVIGSAPVKIRGAAMESKAFKLWTDDYFISLPESSSYQVTVEGAKKENRSHPVRDMSLEAFVRSYRSSDIYMVHPVPEFLRKDVALPAPLGCPQIYSKILAQNIMWMSSGGTKSVVHTDSVDNINCLLSGEKQFVLIDPHKFGSKVDLDFPDGAYSGVDVDRVDFEKYPGLAEVEYHIVNLTAGDCLFIPYKWIHQVRSYERNLAVNIWWDHRKVPDIDLDLCARHMEDKVTLERCSFSGLENINEPFNSLKDFLLNAIAKEISLGDFINIFVTDHDKVLSTGIGDSYRTLLTKMFEILDSNDDDLVSFNEITSASNKDWEEVERFRELYDKFMDTVDYLLERKSVKDEL